MSPLCLLSEQWESQAGEGGLQVVTVEELNPAWTVIPPPPPSFPAFVLLAPP